MWRIFRSATKFTNKLHQSGNFRYKCVALPEKIRSLPTQFLRASDSRNYDPDTHQRTDIPYDSLSGKPRESLGPKFQTDSIKHVSSDEKNYYILWNDGVDSTYSKAWVDEQVNRIKSRTENDRIFWTDLTEEKVRESSDLSIEFKESITTDGMKKALRSIYKYGILLVKNTPIDSGSGVAALGAALGGGNVKASTSTSILTNYLKGGSDTILEHGTDGPMRTLYGSVWSTSSIGQEDGTSKADSAYGTDGLPLHTDMTYMRDPPGLQIFTMVQPAPSGGESVFGDGFAVADELKATDPESFVTLSTVSRRYRCVDQSTGWNLQAYGPIISVRQGRVVGIRHNDLDRLPDLPPSELEDPTIIEAFYDSLKKAHAAWDNILRQDKYRLVMRLLPGDTMVVANQRCFHGRHAFNSNVSSPRAVMGCYVSQDELSSRFRREGMEDL